jgi:CRISPR-associated protein Cas6
MYWQEDQEEEIFAVPDDVVDLVFKIECKALRNDHAWALSGAIQAVLPWFGEQPEQGLHIIHVAESASGWTRPEAPDEIIYPSRRTRLKLRLPKEQVADAQALTGHTLDIDGHGLKVGDSKTQLLGMTNTLYSRYVVSPEAEDDEAFVGRAVEELRSLGLKFSKVLAGKSHVLNSPDGAVFTKTLMVGGLSFPDAVTLQEKGLGPHRDAGCGLFTPCKSI